jgi:hypothetical protein
MRKVSNRATNAANQNHNNFSLWMRPLSHRQYPVTDVFNPARNAVITSDGSREFVYAQSKFTFDGSRVDVTGTLHTSGTIDTSSNITSVGTMIPSTYRSGQVVNVVFLDATNISQYVGDVTSTSDYQIASYTYTPLYANSKIIVDYGCLYNVSGNAATNTDAFESRINIDSTLVAKRQQQWLDSSSGTGTRGSTLYPITGGISNSALTPRTISVTVRRTAGDDGITFYGATFDAFMRITEIGA